MNRRAWVGLSLIIFGGLAILQPAGAQVVDYGKSLPKDPAATEEFGIVAYNLSQDGDIYSIELLGVKGTLAFCQVLMGEVQEATCEVTGKGHFRTRIGKKLAEFEDLSTGEYTRVHFERVGPGESGLEELAPGETLEVGETAIVNGFSMRVESPLSADEIERRWGEISGLMGHALTEVALTFGMLEQIIEEQSKELLELREQELRDMGKLQNSENFDLCPEGQQQVCVVGAVGGYYASAFGGTKGFCCSVASGSADSLCFQATGRGCCANTLCATEGFTPLISCGLDGIPWSCSSHC